MTPRVRFGGVLTPHGYRYELTGGRVCLDFANTMDERRTDHPRELLRRYRDLLNWAAQSGALTREDARILGREAARRRRGAAVALGRARRVREAIFDLFAAVARHDPAPAGALAALNRVLAGAARDRHLVPRGTRFVWRWGGTERRQLDRVLGPVVWSAAELLGSRDLERVRQCAGAGCGWLFLDTTRNRSRRWCDMSVCGNRAKARRFYAKARRR